MYSIRQQRRRRKDPGIYLTTSISSPGEPASHPSLTLWTALLLNGRPTRCRRRRESLPPSSVLHGGQHHTGFLRSGPLTSSPARAWLPTPTVYLPRIEPSLVCSTADRAAPTTEPIPPPKRTGYVWKTVRTVFLLGIGFSCTLVNMILQESVTRLSDTETAREWTPRDETEQAHDDYLNAHPMIRALREDPAFTESRPHLKIPPHMRAANLTAGTLMGPRRVPFPPVAWLDEQGPKKTYVQVGFVGEELCGHPGIVHGGYLATLLDEGFARCAFAALPSHVGVTANLNINYRAPCKAGQYIVLRGEVVKAEGRKAWVEGRIETLPELEGEKPVVLAEGTGLFIEPKQLAVSFCLLFLRLIFF